jgi:hypothetical protein
VAIRDGEPLMVERRSTDQLPESDPLPPVVNGSFTTFNGDALTAPAMVKRQDQAGSVESFGCALKNSTKSSTVLNLS